jgi:hypothetical protein
LGRRVDADSRLLAPEFRPWSKVIVHEDGRTLSLSWARDAAMGLHSIAVIYAPDRVTIGTRMGTRPAFWGRSRYLVRTVIVEHAVVRLREALRGRPIEMMPRNAIPVTRTL